MLKNQKNNLKEFTNQPISLIDEVNLLKHDAVRIFDTLMESQDLTAAQQSLESLKAALVQNDKSMLVEIMANHSLLLAALSQKLLVDAGRCSSPKFANTLIELSLKSFDTTRKTILATNELASTPTPTVAIQINNSNEKSN